MTQPCFVHETLPYLEDEYFKVGMSDLQVRLLLLLYAPSCLHDTLAQSWDWAYGQTPEFEYVIRKTFVWGQLVSSLALYPQAFSP